MVHLSQILQHTHFPEEGVAHEMKAIRREAATGLDAVAQLHVKARDYAVFGKPYGRAVIGYHDKLDFTADKMTQLHAQQYKLGNMALVVAGAAKLDQVIDLANNYFVQDADDTLPRQSELGVELEEYHTTGLVRGDSSNVRINVSYPFPSEFREKFNRERLAYGMAATAISDVCFREMRYEKGISYDGSVSFSTYNHPNAWALTGGVTTDKESLNVANGVFDDIFSRRGSDYDDDALTGALQMYKYYFNLKVGSLDDRVSSHIGRLQEYRQPEDLSTILRRVKKVRIQDIREAIDDLADIAQSTPRYTHLTGARDAIGDVERIIDQSEFA